MDLEIEFSEILDVKLVNFQSCFSFLCRIKADRCYRAVTQCFIETSIPLRTSAEKNFKEL
jgi:hypothetical protein